MNMDWCMPLTDYGWGFCACLDKDYCNGGTIFFVREASKIDVVYFSEIQPIVISPAGARSRGLLALSK